METLTDERLRALAEPASDDPHRMFKESGRRQRDAVLSIIREPPQALGDPIENMKEKIAQLESQLATAIGEHDKKYPPGAVFGEAGESSRKIGTLEIELGNARRHLSDLEAAEQSRQARRALAGATRLFEVTAPDGRKIRQAGTSAEELQKRLQFDYRVSSEIFEGGYVARLDGAGFRGWLAAHGEALVTYLAERGFSLKRGKE